MLKSIPNEVMTMQPAVNIKESLHKLADQLPEDATWDDVLYTIVEGREIQAGLADSAAGRTTPVEDVMKEFGIKP